jgi:regulator of protease activity HflC (stomatin/prohibitin superfamily)
MFSIKQGTVGVMLRFGKYKKICPSGLNFKIPGVDSIVIFTMQNQAAELSFQAITKDQANVYFKALVIYSTKDSTEDTIKKVAFTFASGDQFAQAMSKTIEGMVRSFIAGKNQQEVLGLRKEIIEYVQEHITSQLETWGYSLHDIQVNDISFDRVIMDSMAQVVASANLKAAATNEGDALMIKKTKTAEAEGNAIMIMARNEKDAEILRGQGVAGFREAIAEGMKVSLDKVGGEKGQEIAVQLISLSMWLDTFKNVAENGTGNFINFDGSPEGLQRFMQSNVVSAASAVSNKK